MPEVLETPLLPTGAEVLAEAAGKLPAHLPDTELVRVRLTVDQASLLWERLHRLTQKEHRYQSQTLQKELITHPPILLGYLWDRLSDLCSTTPHVRSRAGVIQFLTQGLTLRLRRHQAKYVWRILKNKQHDEWRRENRERDLFCPLEVAEKAEAGSEEDELSDGVQRPYFRPTHHENPEAQMRRTFLKKALKELPRKLKMPAKDVRSLLDALMEANGNVSEAARITGQPQRKTARRIQRIIAHLKRRGFSA